MLSLPSLDEIHTAMERALYLEEYLAWRRSHGWPSHAAAYNEVGAIERLWAEREVSKAERLAYRRAQDELNQRIHSLMEDETAAMLRGLDLMALVYLDECERLVAAYERLCELDPEI